MCVGRQETVRLELPILVSVIFCVKCRAHFRKWEGTCFFYAQSTSMVNSRRHEGEKDGSV